MESIEVLSVNISKKKGVVKEPIEIAKMNDEGIVGDAHAGKWHRQVSLLAQESIEKAEKTAKAHFPFGTFAENITTQGIELHKTNILDRFINDKVELEVTQIGKKCHAKCAIGKQIGNCIMPLEGIFARVIKQGMLKSGDCLEYKPKIFNVNIITLSDRASSGIYEDKSGPLIAKEIQGFFKINKLKINITSEIIPDEINLFHDVLQKSFSENYDIIFTTGSTGIGIRDIAPETILPFLDKQIPGIMEMIRTKYGMEHPNALLSRSVAGIKNKTLLFALPGSPKAVSEYINEILKVLYHTILMVHDIGNH